MKAELHSSGGGQARTAWISTPSSAAHVAFVHLDLGLGCWSLRPATSATCLFFPGRAKARGVRSPTRWRPHSPTAPLVLRSSFAKRTSGPAAGAWCGRPWCPTWSLGFLSAETPARCWCLGSCQARTWSRGSSVAAGRALQPPAAGRRLSLHQVSPMQAQEAGGGTPPGLRCAGPLTERPGACSLAFPLGLEHALPATHSSCCPQECHHLRWGPVLTLRPIRVLAGFSGPQAAHGGHALDHFRSRARHGTLRALEHS